MAQIAPRRSHANVGLRPSARQGIEAIFLQKMCGPDVIEAGAQQINQAQSTGNSSCSSRRVGGWDAVHLVATEDGTLCSEGCQNVKQNTSRRKNGDIYSSTMSTTFHTQDEDGGMRLQDLMDVRIMSGRTSISNTKGLRGMRGGRDSSRISRLFFTRRFTSPQVIQLRASWQDPRVLDCMR